MSRLKYSSPHRLGRHRAGERAQKVWTPEETAYLRDNYGLVTDLWLTRVLGRTENAIRQRAIKIGCTRTSNFFTSCDVARIMGVWSSTVVEWIKKGLLQGEKSKVVGVGRNMAWCIHQEALVAFITTHADIYDYRRIDPIAHRYWRNLANRCVVRVRAPRIVRKWTPQEDAYILNHHAHTTYREMAAHTHRTKEAAHQRIRTLRIEGRMVPYKGYWRSKRLGDRLTPADYDDWTEAEDQWLRENWARPRRADEPGVGKQNRRYRYITCAELARELGRTKDACLSRAYRLNCNRGRGRRRDLEEQAS